MLSERMKYLTPYVPGEQPQDKSYIKLNTNENPFPPTPRIKEFLESFDIDRLKLYPDPVSAKLKEAIAKNKNVKTENIFVSNGSDEALSFAFYAFFDAPRGNLLFPEFTYSFYPVYADFYRIPYTRIPLDSQFNIDLDDYLERPSCGVIIPNPNAPTGIALPAADIRRFLDAYPGDRVVILDEAYVDFGAESSVELINRYPNLMVIQTFSKGRSLAALRLGYTLAQPELIRAISTVKDSFNSYPVDTLAQTIGLLAMEDEEYYRNCSRKIEETRDRFSLFLKARGWQVLPSRSNFLFARKDGYSGQEIYSRLKEKGFLVRHFGQEGIADFVRISVGTDRDMDALGELIGRLFT